ncbi:MAG: putative rane protein putative virulence factor [Acidimicrobiales bacterium]|jgi:putative peptidoglycan lipid II flippase|nr:putative rane protein putative virulence factor [Acidimicrobiales bacterium]
MSATEPDDLLRATAAITAGNVASRITGFVRVLAIAAALGTTFLGNTYQSANLVSNILFELLAAGLLSSVLVPTFVGLLDAGRRDEAEHVAGALLGLALTALGVVTAIAMVASPLVMRGLTIAVSDAAVRHQEIRLGTFFVAFFLPQVLLYAVGAVATALLHGDRRFSAPAFAPVANNLVVIATMAAYVVVRHSRHPGLALTTGERLLLAAGTTAGVLAMTVVPVVTAWRAGLRLRPRWDPGHPLVRSLARPGAWAAGYLALNQLLIATTLVLANQVAGGVVAYQVAFQFFLLPNALLANPVFTALYPAMAADASAARWADFNATLRRGIRMIAVGIVPSTVALIVLGRPVLHLMQLGAFNRAGATLTARVLVAYAVGLLGYACFQLLTRASYATGDIRTPTLVNLGLTLGGSALMLVLFAAASGGQRVVNLGWAHSLAMTAGAIALGIAVRARAHGAPPTSTKVEAHA